MFIAGIPYEITVWTGNERGAGTDSNVFMQMYGEGGKTEEFMVRNRTDNFEQGQVDKFKVMKQQVLTKIFFISFYFTDNFMWGKQLNL